MRITLIGPVYPFRGGIAHYTTLLAHALTEQHVVQVVSFRRQYPSFLYPGVSDLDPSTDSLKFPATYLLDPIYPWTWFDTVNKVCRFNPDVVVIQWWTTFWGPSFGVLANRLMSDQKKVVFIIHNVLPHEPRFWDTWLTRWGLRCGYRYIVQTEQESKRLFKLLPHAKVELAPHPVYDMFSQQKITRADAIRKCNLPEDASILLFFGIVRPYKGLEYLFNAVSILNKEGVNIFLVVAGEFWENESHYREMIKQLNIQDCVLIDNRYIPNEEIGLYFSAAHIFIAPYIQATQSGAVKMAMGFNLPIIISDKVAQDNSLQPSATCIVCPSKDSMALAEAIQRMLNDYPELDEISDLGLNAWEPIITAITRVD
jgi:glycosyltransferase involved in cell wall biosynthesis